MVERSAILKDLVLIMNGIKKTTFNLEEITEETYLGGDMGVDSIEMLEALHDIQKQYSVKIPVEEMTDIYTMKDVIDLLQKHMA
jgi:acyl carrier protein